MYRAVFAAAAFIAMDHISVAQVLPFPTDTFSNLVTEAPVMPKPFLSGDIFPLVRGGLTYKVDPTSGVAVGNYAPDNPPYGYGGTLTPYLRMTLGSNASPDASSDAVALFQKIGANSASAAINGVIWSDFEVPTGILPSYAHGTGVVGQVNVYGSSNGNIPFFEGMRGNCNLEVGSAGVACEGAVSEINLNTSNWLYALGNESAININNGVDSPVIAKGPFNVLNQGRWDAAYLSSCGDHGPAAGLAKCGTGFMVNPNNTLPTHWGFYIPPRTGGGGIDIASFQSDDTTGQYGLDLGAGAFSGAAIRVPTGDGLSSVNRARSANIQIVGTNSLDNVLLGPSTSASAVVIGDPAGIVPTRVTGTVSFGTSSPFTLSRGEIGLAVTALSERGPGPGAVKFAAACGTTAGTAKIVVYAGTSATPVTLLDNIGSGVSGC
jgi:hypothetical protein